ncbi:hypothetical protein BGZ88_009747 [Linnemannia elongata]|nr:hypothetical protein BGZ88_009747 [Linnemannia elongata]
MSHSTSSSRSTLHPRGGGQRKTALMFIGNTGVGKSALLNQLGGNFKSGFNEQHGVTTSITEKTIVLGSETVVLMDVPGLIEPSKEATDRNAGLLVKALSRGYDFRLTIVVQASNRTMTTDDLALICEVNKCLVDAGMLQDQDGGRGQVQGEHYDFSDEKYESPIHPKISFRIIVNGISGQKLYEAYEWYAADKFQAFFADNNTIATPFDIQVDEVLLLRADDDAVESRGFKEELTNFVLRQKPVPVSVAAAIKFDDDFKTKIRVAAARSQGWMEGALVGAAGTPLEILEKISSYANGYVCCVLGLNLSSPRIRECISQSGGPGRVFSEILSRGGDSRALLTIKNLIPSHAAIAKAVVTMDRKMLDKIIFMYGTDISDGGLKLAIEMDFGYAVEIIKPSLDKTIRHRNAYYISKGMYDKLDKTIEDPCGMVYGVGGDPSLLLPWCNGVTLCKMLAFVGQGDRVLEILDDLGQDRDTCIPYILELAPMEVATIVYTKYESFTHKIMERLVDLSPIEGTMTARVIQMFIDHDEDPPQKYMYLLVGAGGFLVKNGMESRFITYLAGHLSHVDILSIFQAVDISNVYNAGWRHLFGALDQFSRAIPVDELISNGYGKSVLRLAREGHDITGNYHTDYGVDHVRATMMVRGEGVLDEIIRNIFPRTVEDAMWIMHHPRFRVELPEEEPGLLLTIYMDVYYIPIRVEVDPYDCPHFCDECGLFPPWMDYIDTCLYSMYPHVPTV